MPGVVERGERWRQGGRRRTRAMSEINVTPMVDVMLVLLIIFMVTAPLLTSGVEVDLPDAASSAIKDEDEPLAVSVNAQGSIFVQDTEVTLETLAPRLAALIGRNKDTRIFVRGDKAIDYGRVMQVVGAINAAGYRKVALLTDPRVLADAAAGDEKPKAR
ncbi:MAG: protein TolR [Hyphomicrobium sp.]